MHNVDLRNMGCTDHECKSSMSDSTDHACVCMYVCMYVCVYICMYVYVVQMIHAN